MNRTEGFKTKLKEDTRTHSLSFSATGTEIIIKEDVCVGGGAAAGLSTDLHPASRMDYSCCEHNGSIVNRKHRNVIHNTADDRYGC